MQKTWVVKFLNPGAGGSGGPEKASPKASLGFAKAWVGLRDLPQNPSNKPGTLKVGCVCGVSSCGPLVGVVGEGVICRSGAFSDKSGLSFDTGGPRVTN